MSKLNVARVCIVSFSDDTHAKLVGAMLQHKYSVSVVHINADSCEASVSLSAHWHTRSSNEEFDVIWVRRKNFLNIPPVPVDDIASCVNVAQSNFDALHAYLSRRADICVNHPDKALLIENKAIQLCLAQEAGLHVPPTLISASYEEIMRFSRAHGQVIVKNMRPLGGNPTGVFNLDESMLSPSNCRQSYTIYQQKVIGSKHLRVAVFGRGVFAFKYESSNLDSRFDARSNATLVDLPQDLVGSILNFLDRAGLKMGILDFKESLEGHWYFLEVNQQGAFAYLDPLANFPLLDAFVRFLIVQATQKRDVGA